MYPTSKDCAVGDSSSTTLLNDFHLDFAETSLEGAVPSFPQFSRLPAEIAFLIWKQVLQQHRLISITICDKAYYPFWESDHVKLDAKNSLGQVTSGKNYRLQVTSHHALTPLLRTNRESRKAALEFYRVHIPYDRLSYGEQRCLYLNPELDFLHVNVETKPHPTVLADFIHDLKAYDPRGVGVLNIGIGGSDQLHVELPLCSSDVSSHVRQSFIDIMSNLRLVFFYSATPTGDTRIMFDSLDMAEARFNRSYPIYALTQAFDLIGSDPRPIDTYLDKVGLGLDPRRLARLWKLMERNFGIVHEPGRTSFVYHIAAPASAENREAFSRADAMKMLQREHEGWRLQWEKEGIWGRNGYEDPDTPDKLRSAPITAFGFWILPLEALGEVPEEEPRRWEMKRVVNLVKHRPQLGVFRLPRETSFIEHTSID